METLSALLTVCAGNAPVTPQKGQWHWALTFSLICARMNGWVNNSKAGDVRRHCAHYDVIVMWSISFDWHRGRVTQICVGPLDHHWFRTWYVAYAAPNSYLNQWLHFVILTDEIIFRSNLNQNTDTFNQVIAIGNFISNKWWTFSSGCFNDHYITWLFNDIHFKWQPIMNNVK